jgi:hypothetical protein
MYVILALAILATGVLLMPDAYAGGRHHRHGHGHHNGSSFHLGLGFVFPLYSYGYPYYAPAPVYAVPAQIPPVATQDQRSYTASREEAAYCREYTKNILVDGREEMSYGTACLQVDGRWRIMN